MKHSNFRSVLSFALQLVSVFFSASSLVHAGSRGDYNVGAGTVTSIEIGGASTVSGGVFANGEFVSLDRDSGEFAIKDVVFFDARLTSFIGGGVSVNERNVQGIFRLKLMGSINGGLMVYQILPVNIGLEDASLEIRGNQVLGSALVGSTVVLPVSLLAGMEGTELYVSVTAGMRLNSELEGPAAGIQPKIRVVTDRMSLEARALFTFGSTESERKVNLMGGVNSVFTKNDQIGLMASWDELTRSTGMVTSGVGIMIYYGRNL